jgi:signal transduction histidine kinase
MQTKSRWPQQKQIFRHKARPYHNTHRLEASAMFNAAMRQAESRQQALRILLDQSLVAFSAEAAGVYELKENALLFKAGRGLSFDPPARLPADTSSVLGRSIYLGRILQFDTSLAEDGDCDFCGFLDRQGFQYLLVTPLRTSQKNVGVLFIALRHKISLALEDEQLLSAFSEAAGATLHRFMVMEQLEQTVTNRDLELVLLYDLMEIAGGTTDVETLLRSSLKRILEASDCVSGVIHFTDPTDHRLTVAVSDQLSEEFSTYLAISGLATQLWERVYREQEVVQVQSLPDRSSPERPDPNRQYYSYLGVPIRIKGKTVGVLSLISQSDRLLSPGIIQMASSAANVLGLTVESAHFRQKAEDAIILNERQRLGRNLHDSVSQSLYALVISADVSEKLLRIKDYPGLRQQLRDLGKVAQQGLKEMRLMLYEFRPASLEAGGLAKALEERLQTVEHRAGIETSMSIDGNIDLPPQMEQEIYQIAIEGLNNSLKHAEASVISISLHKDAENIYLVIQDDGRGFDQTSPRPAGGMGMDSMRERARILGGELSVVSAPGAGVMIQLAAPLARATALKE